MDRNLIDSPVIRHFRSKSRADQAVDHLKGLLTQGCMRVEAALKQGSAAQTELLKAKSRFLRIATRAVDRELSEKSSLLDRHCEKLQVLLDDLTQQAQQVLKDEISAVSVALAKDKLDKTLMVLLEEETKLSAVDIELEVVSKKTLESLTRRSSRTHSPAHKEYLSTSICHGSKDPPKHFREEEFVTSDAKSTFRNDFDFGLSELQMENQLVVEENKKLQRQLIELNKTLDRFESQYNTLKEEYWILKQLWEDQSFKHTQSDSLLHSWSENDHDWKTKATTLEEELLNIKQASPVAFYERQLDNIKTIYSDRYNELFKLTSAQIRKLETQLAETKKHPKAEEEVDRLKRMHLRDLETLKHEFNELLRKARIAMVAASRKLTHFGETKLAGEIERVVALISARECTKPKVPQHRRCKSSSVTYHLASGHKTQGSATHLLDQYLSSYY